MQKPTVSFVIPCYKLAHLLPECINSILSQAYGDFEVLIMDDCSPDNTAEVAKSFHDPRVKYVRNEKNLGHLHNYNKGISQSCGKYIWLISADDYLRKQYVLERYVGLLEKHPNVGYVICPGFGVRDGMEARVLGRYSQHGDCDRIVRGHDLLSKLICSNFVMTPSGLVRRTCYEKISFFPLNMPWCGDWFLWCLFALYHDVAYFAEPMVCYREDHALSMTSKLTRERLDACVAEEVAVPWIIRRKAKEGGYSRVAEECLSGAAQTYARTLVTERYRESRFFMNFEMLEDSIRQNIMDEAERNCFRLRVYEKMGNEYYWKGELVSAKQFYQLALKNDPWMAAVRTKILFLSLGKMGDYIRKTILSFR
jgi:glycosyltransferase involved in cell wall biosynthesis